MRLSHVGAAALGLVLVLFAGAAHAQEITGRVTGRVTDQGTGAPIGGVTVIAQGGQGEDATLTDDRGEYHFTSLPVGTYVLRFYAANTSSQLEQPGVVVSADKMVRINAKLTVTPEAAPQQTYVITGKAPTIDIGSARVGAQFDEQFTQNVPVGRTYGDVIEKAPGTFVDGTGNISIAGATGLENIYIVNGLNVTGIEYGNLESGSSNGGGTNLPIEFLTQIEVSSGGYQAEYGGAMGGVVNSVLKSGSNEFHGSAFTYFAPYWLSGDPKAVIPIGSALGGIRKPDFDNSIGVEVGGPIFKDKLFFWAGFAPRIINSHVFRLTYAQSEDPSNPGAPLLDAAGNPAVQELRDWRARIDESRKSYYYAGSLDWIPRPDHRLTFNVLGSPSFNNKVRDPSAIVDPISANPRYSSEKLTKTNTDLSLHWVSRLFDNHWQIDAVAGMHSEYYNDRSPHSELNSLNQLQYTGANLWDLEQAPGCEPTASGFQPCPVNPNYFTGGFGLVKKYSAFRWSGEVKSTHLFEAVGHHEVRYGWHVELANFDQDRYYSGPLGSRALVQLFPGSGFNTTSFFTLQPGERPTDYSTGLLPASNLLYPPDYQDNLKAYVKSLSNALFLQDSYSPSRLRNLSVNVGARLELQKIYDYHGSTFLDTSNLAPRLSAVYDPFNDGRSKMSVSYGRYYEAVPLDIAARYFGGENFLNRQGVPLNTCAGSTQDAYSWTGAADYRQCTFPTKGGPDDPYVAPQPIFNSEQAQAKLQGQYHNEIVATVEREIIENLTARIDYQHRWLGAIIEDGAADPLGATFVLANPGHVPQESINQAKSDVYDAEQAAKANPDNPELQSKLAAAQGKLTSLEGLAAAPKPERTYDAITFTVNRRFSKNWLARAAYTYSRLVGNYEGLYQAEQNYVAPNGNNAYDFPELYINANGRLPNDRPHNFHVDGFYSHEIGKGRVTFGLSFLARSGMPRNYMGALIPNQQLVFLLPRGAGGRTPAVTEFDGRIAYSRQITPKMRLEAFIDLFNIINQQSAILVDDNYTFEPTPAVVNGTANDLKYAKNVGGTAITKNPNYGRPIAFQRPFSGRLGLRLTF